MQRDEEIKIQLSLFSQRLAMQRKAMGLTQEQLSTSLGATQNVQSRYELGTSVPKIDYLIKLAGVGFNVPQLLFANEREGLYALDSQEQTVMELYRQVDTETKLQVLSLLAGGNIKQAVVNQQGGDVNQNTALIAGKQSIKTKKQK